MLRVLGIADATEQGFLLGANTPRTRLIPVSIPGRDRARASLTKKLALSVTMFLSVVFGLACDHGMADEVSFVEAYDLARESAIDLALARYEMEGAKAQKGVMLGRILPQVNVFGQWSQNKVDYDLGLISETQDYPGERYGLQIRQPLLNVSDGLEVQRFDLLYQQSQQQLAVAEADLLAAVVESFLGVILAKLDLSQFESELHALENQLAEAKALYNKQLLPVTQVLETQTRAETIKAEVIRASGALEIAKEQLTNLTGIREVEPLAVLDKFVLMTRHASPEDAAAMAVANSPMVTAAEIAVQAADKAVLRERGSWIPNVDLTYSYQYSDVGFDNLSSPPRDTSTIAVGFNYPLFEGGAGNARLRVAQAEYRIAQTRLDGVSREIKTRARSAWLNLEAVTERLLAAQQAVNTATVNVDAAQKSVKAGTARVTDTLLALAQNTRAQRDFGSARFEFAAAWLELELAAGGDPIALASKLSTALHGP